MIFKVSDEIKLSKALPLSRQMYAGRASAESREDLVRTYIQSICFEHCPTAH